MATKAAKSITINATKYTLANALGVADGKIQLKAGDVVLDEVDAPASSEAIFVYNHYDSDEGYYVTDAIKDIEGNVLTNAQACGKVKAGAQIYVQVEAASGSNNGKFQLLDKYVHEEYSGGSVVQETFWSDDNSFGKYIDMTFRLSTNWVSAPNIRDTKGGYTVVEARLTSDMSVNQVGVGAGWRGLSFPVMGMGFNDVVALLEANKVVYIALKGSTNELTAYAPLSLTRKFAADMWFSQLTFVADGSLFVIDDTPEIKRTTNWAS